MAAASTRWSNRAFETLFGAAYDFGVEHEWLARPVGVVLLGTRVRQFYAALTAVGAAPDGAAVLDVPCGGGIALRGLRAGQRVRYVAADISPVMLERTRRRAARRSTGVELVTADMHRLPFDDGEFDLCVSFNGLHVLPQPELAVQELARCVRPGGRVVGCCILRGELRRTDVWIRGMRAAGIFGAPGTRVELDGWLTGAGLRVESLTSSGAVGYFAAVRVGQP